LATKVIDALKAKLGDKGKVTTGGYSLDPQYDQRPNAKPTIVGYKRARHGDGCEYRRAGPGWALIDSANCGRREIASTR